MGRFLDVVTGRPSTEGPGILLWLVTPAAVAVLLRAFAGDGWRDSGLTPNLRGNVRWYVVALLVYPVLTAVVVALGWVLGMITIAGLSWAVVAAILQSSALALAPQVLKNIFEESAWRGYLAPKIYGLGWNDYVGHAVVGLVWGAWHIPYCWLFSANQAAIAAEFCVYGGGWTLIAEATNEMTTKSRPATPLIRHRVADENMTRLHGMPAILALEGLDPDRQRHPPGGRGSANLTR